MDNITYAIIGCYPDKGMKSHGSKGLISFNNKRLFEHQLDWIQNTNTHNEYETILICDFDIAKIKKTLISSKIKIHQVNNTNPIYAACELSKYDNLIIIDYGCLFNPVILDNFKRTSILCVTDNEHLDTGCVIKDNIVEHIFLDLHDDKFCNIFRISREDKTKILSNNKYKSFNLLYFEILNMLIDSGSKVMAKKIDRKDFFYFTQMRQKNAANKFIKKLSN